MPSPNFVHRKKTLDKVFAVSALIFIWKKKVRNDFRDHLVFDALEYTDFHSRIATESRGLSDAVCGGEYVPERPLRVSMEKAKGLCRHLTVPAPRDALILQALSDAIYPSLKDAAPSKKAHFEQKSFVFKSKNEYNQDSYGTFESWLSFQGDIFDFSKSYRYIVVTDVANFYDHISHSHLRNIIASTTQVPEVLLDALIYMLSAVGWQPDYLPAVPIGIPQIASDAPRILAHAFLYEADRYLSDRPGSEFTRFMDDIDVGVNSIPEAKAVLRDLDVILGTRQIRLNSGKTTILKSSDAIKYFWIRENYVLDKVGTYFEKNKNRYNSNFVLISILRKRFIKQYKIHNYKYGNGEKILKRYIGILKGAKSEIPYSIVCDILKNRPGARREIFRYMAEFGVKKAYVEFCSDLIDRGYFIDDAAVYYFAKYLVDARFRNSNALRADIVAAAVGMLQDGSTSRFMSGLWIASKYCSNAELINLIDQTKGRWGADPILGRLVGGLACRFKKQSPFQQRLADLVQLSYNRTALEAMRFALRVAAEPNAFQAIFNILKAPNPTFPNGISHGKFLLVMTAKLNPNVPAASIAILNSVHKEALKDRCYAQIARSFA